MLSSFLSAVFWGVLVLSLLVFVHEGGHFIAARIFGMRVTEFFLGLPSRWRISFKSRRLGTEFGVTPLLLGGYNRICGMEGSYDELCAPVLAYVQQHGRVQVDDMARDMGIDEARAYQVMATLVDLGSIRPYYNSDLDEHPWQSEWPQAFETLQRDANLLNEYDRGHDFEGASVTQAGEPRPVGNADEFLHQELGRTYEGKKTPARLATLLAGPLVNILFAFVLVVGSLTIAGVEVVSDSNTIGGVTEGSYAEQAGLKAGDTIVSLNNQSVTSWGDLVTAIDGARKQGGSIPVAYMRAGETFETTLELPEDKVVDIIGVNAKIESYHLSFGEATAYTLRYIQMVATTIMRLLIPTHTIEIVSQSSSIVGISAMASEAAASGINDLILLAAAISLSLGFMNLLPIPPLDGGKILIELVQLALRRRISVKAQNIISYVGLAFVLFIFCFALRNDILRIVGGLN